MKKTKKTLKSGFTLVELSFSIVFISILLMTIAVVTSRIIGVYHKGNTIRQINAVGRELIDEFSGAVAESSSFSTISKDDIFVERIGKDSKDRNVQTSGAFCTGKYSYIWNTGYGLIGSSAVTVNSNSFRLLKIEDSPKQICASLKDPSNKNINAVAVTELLEGNQLAVYNFQIYLTQDEQTHYSLYNGSFVLASALEPENVDLTTGDNFCKSSNGSSSSLETEFNYCAINKFNFAIRATGGMS